MTLKNALPYLRSNNSIVSNLDLSQSLLERDELQELEQALGHPFCRTLISLEMRGCAMSDEGAAAVFRGLAKNYSVTRLDLTNSTLGPFGVRALADALASNSTLATLSVWGCGLGPARAETLFAGLAENESLKEVVIFRFLPPCCADSLRADSMYTSCQRPVICDLHNMQIRVFVCLSVCLFCLSVCLSVCLFGCQLDLGNNDYGASGLHHLKEALARNTKLCPLNCDDDRLCLNLRMCGVDHLMGLDVPESESAGESPLEDIDYAADQRKQGQPRGAGMDWLYASVTRVRRERAKDLMEEEARQEEERAAAAQHLADAQAQERARRAEAKAQAVTQAAAPPSRHPSATGAVGSQSAAAAGEGASLPSSMPRDGVDGVGVIGLPEAEALVHAAQSTAIERAVGLSSTASWRQRAKLMQEEAEREAAEQMAEAAAAEARETCAAASAIEQDELSEVRAAMAAEAEDADHAAVLKDEMVMLEASIAAEAAAAAAAAAAEIDAAKEA